MAKNRRPFFKQTHTRLPLITFAQLNDRRLKRQLPARGLGLWPCFDKRKRGRLLKKEFFLDICADIRGRNRSDVIAVGDSFQDRIIYERIGGRIQMRSHINVLYVPMQR